jgi:hypothetical protein
MCNLKLDRFLFFIYGEFDYIHELWLPDSKPMAYCNLFLRKQEGLTLLCFIKKQEGLTLLCFIKKQNKSYN